ncbi:hypothetical protein ABQF26_04390 [Mycolicibacterium elephantis]
MTRMRNGCPGEESGAAAQPMEPQGERSRRTPHGHAADAGAGAS